MARTICNIHYQKPILITRKKSLKPATRICRPVITTTTETHSKGERERERKLLERERNRKSRRQADSCRATGASECTRARISTICEAGAGAYSEPRVGRSTHIIALDHRHRAVVYPSSLSYVRQPACARAPHSGARPNMQEELVVVAVSALLFFFLPVWCRPDANFRALVEREPIGTRSSGAELTRRFSLFFPLGFSVAPRWDRVWSARVVDGVISLPRPVAVREFDLHAFQKEVLLQNKPPFTFYYFHPHIGTNSQTWHTNTEECSISSGYPGKSIARRRVRRFDPTTLPLSPDLLHKTTRTTRARSLPREISSLHLTLPA